MPEKVAGKGMSWTARLGIGTVIAVVIICIIVFIASSISRKVSYQVEQKNLEKLESLYQSGDYEGICEYLKKWVIPISHILINIQRLRECSVI